MSVGAVGLMAVWKAVGGGGRKSGVWCEGELRRTRTTFPSLLSRVDRIYFWCCGWIATTAQIPSPPSEAPIPPPAQSMVNRECLFELVISPLPSLSFPEPEP